MASHELCSQIMRNWYYLSVLISLQYYWTDWLLRQLAVIFAFSDAKI